MPSNSFITFAIKNILSFTSVWSESICFVIFVLIPIDEFTVEYERNENQIYSKLF